MHLSDHMTIQEIADHYEATTEAVRLWLILAKKHTLPALDDKLGWFNLIIQDQGSRLEDAKDADSVRLAQNLATFLGVGSAEELKQHLAKLETAKVAIIAQAFDQATKDAPNRRELRSAFLDAIEATPV